MVATSTNDEPNLDENGIYTDMLVITDSDRERIENFLYQLFRDNHKDLQWDGRLHELSKILGATLLMHLPQMSIDFNGQHIASSRPHRTPPFR